MRLITILFFILSFSLMFFWFKDGMQIATGEESLSIFNKRFPIEQISFWQETGTGYLAPHYITRLVPVIFSKILSLVFFDFLLIQAIFLLFIIMFGLVFTYKLISYLLGSMKNIRLVAITGAAFYLFNLYGMSQVWSRFLYAGMSAWALLPALLFYWFIWLKEGENRALFLLLFISFLFSNAFLQPANIFTIWVPAALITPFVFTVSQKTFIIIAKRAGIGFVLWILTNIWWIYPELKLSRLTFSEISDWRANFDSLRGISSGIKALDPLMLYHGLFMAKNGPWGNFYQLPLVKIFAFLPFLVAVAGALKTKRDNFYWYFLILGVLAWFIIKGTNSPLGEPFFKFLFSTFPASASLRNPYEKFGIVWVLAYSFFFAQGVYWITSRFKNKLRNVASGVILFLTCGVLVWPMWTGDVYTKEVRVKIPEYYEEANRFLNQDETDGRILSLPIIPGDGSTYYWGYSGVEPSEFLFDRPAISKILRTSYFDKKYMDLYSKFVGGESYSGILKEMNVKYLVLHNDLDAKARGASSSAEVKNILSRNPEVEFIKSFGDLDIYEFIGNKEGSLFEVQGEDAPSLSYQKLSTTHYKVYVKDVKKPFDLIFKSTFNEFWRARIGKERIGKHFSVYNYANAWKVEKEGSYTIDLVFKIWPWE